MITIPGKIPIRIHPIFWVFVLLISALNAETPFQFFSWVLVIFVSVLVHEMGHALTALAFGQKVRIDLLGFGGLTHRYGARLKAWKDFLIVLNGPLAGIALCLFSYFLLTRPVGYSPNSLYLLQLFFYANVFWTIVNLIPVQPLDGGHLLRISLEGLFGLPGVKTALFISLILSVAASILFFAYNFLLGGILFIMLTYENYKAWRSSLEMSSVDQDQTLQQLLQAAQNDRSQGDEGRAIERLQSIRQESGGKGLLFITATLMLAEILHHQHKAEEAFSILNPLRSKLSAEGLRLLHELAYQTHKWKEAIATGTLAYQARPQYDTAVLNALSHAQLREVQPAIGWLTCAIREGLPQIEQVLSMQEFDPIRQDPQFKNLVHAN